MVTPSDRAEPTHTIRIGSRGSALALWQAEHVKAQLQQLGTWRIEVVIVHTTGDRVTDVPLSRIGDKGLFTKELDQAVLSGEVDLAVHSLKDVPTSVPAGLEICAVTERADPRDALVVAPGRPEQLGQLARGARIGTSSLRRRAQLLALRSDFLVEDLRGNLDTRLRKVAAGEYDAAILALAGLERLGRLDCVAERLDAPGWLPAAGQGALCIITRADHNLPVPFQRIDHAPTRAAVTAERSFLAALEGGCQIPIGVLGSARPDLELNGLVGSIDGRRVLRGTVRGAPEQAAFLGEKLALRLIEQGAREILDEIRTTATPNPAAP